MRAFEPRAQLTHSRDGKAVLGFLRGQLRLFFQEGCNDFASEAQLVREVRDGLALVIGFAMLRSFR